MNASELPWAVLSILIGLVAASVAGMASISARTRRILESKR